MNAQLEKDYAERDTRKVVERWIIEATLELTTPTHLSNGDPDPSVDLSLLSDPCDGRPLLTGATLAGALRSYLVAYLGDTAVVEQLFGGQRGDSEGGQSALIIYDALGTSKTARIELRDGVRIDPTSRTAADKAKYDMHLLAAGTKFELTFELVVTETGNPDSLRQALAIVLQALRSGDIRLGGRKNRGFGMCHVKDDWSVWHYDLRTESGLKGWLSHKQVWATTQPKKEPDIVNALGSSSLPESKRDLFAIDATFEVDGSVLIRSGFETTNGPDTVHLRSYRSGSEEPLPVVSGTTWGGVIRAQATRIANTLDKRGSVATELIDRMFGRMPEGSEDQTPKRASRVRVNETEVEGGNWHLVQNRVAIDRFTGGAYESALFAEQPVYGGSVSLYLELERPTEAEMGLLLLVLKDLWTGHTPIGGEASVGRGRLRGLNATITRTGTGDAWTLTQQPDGLVVENADGLNKYVAKLVSQMEEEQS